MIEFYPGKITAKGFNKANATNNNSEQSRGQPASLIIKAVNR